MSARSTKHEHRFDLTGKCRCGERQRETIRTLGDEPPADPFAKRVPLDVVRSEWGGAWEACYGEHEDGSGPTRLIASVIIHRVNFHVLALRVMRNEVGLLVPYHADDASELESVFALDENSCPQTVEIDGYPGRWVVYATAFGD